MGVFGLGGYFSRYYKDTYLSKIPEDVYSVSIDFNADIYGAFEKTKMQTENLTIDKDTFMRYFYENIFDRLKNYVLFFQPTQILMIVLDGLPPTAKLQQQRDRRLNKKDDNQYFDTRCITPGTNFMFELDAKIKLFLEENKNMLPVNILYSNHLVPGEGEHKIMKYYRENELFTQRDVKGSNILISNDGDLIFLSLLSELDEICIYKRDQYKRDSILSIDLLKTNIKYSKEKLHDFILLGCLLHNDFLPSEPSFMNINDTNVIIDAITKAKKSICYYDEKDRLYKADYKILNKFLLYLNKTSMERLKLFHEDNKFPKYNISSYERDMNEDEFSVNWYYTSLTDKNETLSEIITDKINQNIELDEPFENNLVTVDDKNRMAEEYLKGMIWTLHYYQTDKINQSWSYPFNGYAPLLKDISTACLRCNFDYHTLSNGIKYTVLHQLAAVIPYNMMSDINPKLRPLYSSENLLITERYDKWFYLLDGKGTSENQSYTYPAILPSLDMTLISVAVDELNLSKNFLNKFSNQKYIICNFEGRSDNEYFRILKQYSNRYLNTRRDGTNWFYLDKLLVNKKPRNYDNYRGNRGNRGNNYRGNNYRGNRGNNYRGNFSNRGGNNKQKNIGDYLSNKGRTEISVKKPSSKIIKNKIGLIADLDEDDLI